MAVELLIIAAAMAGFGLIAVRYGADSRDAPRSHEHDLARRGLVWSLELVPARSSTPRRHL
jgi:hypothetical protein